MIFLALLISFLCITPPVPKLGNGVFDQSDVDSSRKGGTRTKRVQVIHTLRFGGEEANLSAAIHDRLIPCP
jgi:hypothetical protein